MALTINLTGVEATSNKDTDGTLALNSDTKYPSQKAVKTYADTKQAALGYTAENTANKNATGGYVGLTLFKINFKNTLNTFTSFFTNSNTAARTYTFKDADGTIAFTSDITGTNSGTNTGDETAARIGTLINGSSAAIPNDADLVATADSSVLKKITWTNVKTFLKTYFDSIYQAILTAANVHTFVDTLTAMTTPVDADRMIIVDNSVSLAKKITWANIKATLKSYFDTIYATLASPTFTGTVVLPSTTSIGNVSSTEIGYVDGVTSAIQTQIDSKSPLASPTFTGTVTSPAIILSSETASTIASFDASKNIKSLSTATYPSLTELSYVKGVTSAIQTQFDNVGEFIQLGGTTYAPADSTTYYFGLNNQLAPGTSTASREFSFIKTGTVTRFMFTVSMSVAGTSETVAVSLRNITTSTDNSIGNITIDAGTNGTGVFNFTPSIAIANTTDRYTIKIVAPTWVTNPTGVYSNVRLFNKY